jgi:Tfp pilus assembly protein PilO
LDYAFKQNLENLIKTYDEHSEYSEKIISDYDEKLKQEVSIKLYKKKPEDITSLEEYNKKINEIKQTFSELDKELVQDTITNYLSDFKDLNAYIAQRNIAEQNDNKKGVPEE